MTDLDGLLHAVLESPADDTPRLIYADAMEESGRPLNLARAEFIRLQLADEGLPRQQELLTLWLGDWFGRTVEPVAGGWWAVGEVGEPDAVRFGVSRGFIHEIANHGLPAGEWTVRTPWEFAETLSANVVDLFTNHPLERVVLDIGPGEEWRIEPADGSDTTPLWACRRADRQRALCRIPSRDRFAANLEKPLRDRAFDLAREVFNDWQATGVAIQDLQRRRTSAG